MSTNTTTVPGAAATSVFSTNELLEQILINLDSARDIIRLSSLNRVAYELIHKKSGPRLKAKTFLLPTQPASHKWVVDRKADDPQVQLVDRDLHLISPPPSDKFGNRLPRPLIQHPVMLNSMLLNDKHYGTRDIYSRLNVETECVLFVPDISTLLQNLDGVPIEGKQYQSTIYNSMLCRPPTNRVCIDWKELEEGEFAHEAYGSTCLDVESGVTLRYLLRFRNQITAKGREVRDIRIPNVLFVTEQEWDWVHGKCKYPGPWPQMAPPAAPKPSEPPAPQASVKSAVKQVFSSPILAAQIICFCGLASLKSLRGVNQQLYSTVTDAVPNKFMRTVTCTTGNQAGILDAAAETDAESEEAAAYERHLREKKHAAKYRRNAKAWKEFVERKEQEENEKGNPLPEGSSRSYRRPKVDRDAMAMEFEEIIKGMDEVEEEI